MTFNDLAEFVRSPKPVLDPSILVMVIWKYSIDFAELLQTTWNRYNNRHVKSCKYMLRTPKVTVSSIWGTGFFLARSIYYFPSFIILILSFSLLTCSIKQLDVSSSIVFFVIPYYLLVYTFSLKMNFVSFVLICIDDSLKTFSYKRSLGMVKWSSSRRSMLLQNLSLLSKFSLRKIVYVGEMNFITS